MQSHAYAAACQPRACAPSRKPARCWFRWSKKAGPNHPGRPQKVIRIYLDELHAEAPRAGLNPDTLVLGCTHYPLLRPLIEQRRPAGHEGHRLRRIRRRSRGRRASIGRAMPRAQPRRADAVDSRIRCFATDSVEKFERLGSRFLGRPVGNVELVDLGG